MQGQFEARVLAYRFCGHAIVGAPDLLESRLLAEGIAAGLPRGSVQIPVCIAWLWR